MAFDQVLGHERARAILSRVLAEGRLPPALLLRGPEGVGKRTLALALARASLCEAARGDACESCRVCARTRQGVASLPERRQRARAQKNDDREAGPSRTGSAEPLQFNHRLHPDLFLVEPSPREIRKAQVEEIVRELPARPFEARARVYVLDDAHAMNENSANRLLKSLEEPPASTRFILVSSSPEALLPTIRSRCQSLRLQSLPPALIERHLVERGVAQGGEARLRAALSGGSLGLALAFEAETYAGERDFCLELLDGVLAMDARQRIEAAQRLADGDDPLLALTALRSLLRDLVALRAGARVLNVDVADRLEIVARSRLGEAAAALAEEVAEAREAVRGNAFKPLSFDVLVDSLATAAAG
jgi:DNA polymerase-3 subunit delta'